MVVVLPRPGESGGPGGPRQITAAATASTLSVITAGPPSPGLAGCSAY